MRDTSPIDYPRIPKYPPITKWQDSCCSIPNFLLSRFETLQEWSIEFHKACCAHDDRYRGLIAGSWSREIADTLFWADLQKIARDIGRKHGPESEADAFRAAKDIYEAVTLGGVLAWRKHRRERILNRIRLFGRYKY